MPVSPGDGSAGASCRSAEIQRSMYIAASTIASEASAPISHQSRNAPSSTRNSEAKSAEPGHGERRDAARS